jgi:hypothetical protein
MLKTLAQWARPVLEAPLILETRRNHGLEHATIHVLSRGRYRLSGRSDERGFVLIGQVPTPAVESAVQEALRRMKGGEHRLAVHPNCGTNLVTAGVLTGLIGAVGFGGTTRRGAFARLPWVMGLLMAAVLYSVPLGMALQTHFTTEGDPGDLQLVSVKRSEWRLPFRSTPLVIHRVETR